MLRSPGHAFRATRDCAGTVNSFARVSPATELSLAPSVLATPVAWRRGLVTSLEEALMNGIIYIVGLIVVIMFILSVLGLR